jgi:hypothetical protein
MAVNMQTSFLHPPFGFSLFFLRSVAPATVRTSDIYWGAIPFVVIQVLMVALIIIFPSLVTIGFDRPVHSGEPTPVQILAPREDQGGSGVDAPPDDTADLFRQLGPPPQQ